MMFYWKLYLYFFAFFYWPIFHFFFWKFEGSSNFFFSFFWDSYYNSVQFCLCVPIPVSWTDFPGEGYNREIKPHNLLSGFVRIHEVYAYFKYVSSIYANFTSFATKDMFLTQILNVLHDFLPKACFPRIFKKRDVGNAIINT